MMLVELKPLFVRLNTYCTMALEGAAGLTLARNHYEISLEHMLRRLIDEPTSDIPLILAQADIDVLRLQAQLDETLAQLKNGNPGRPVFAERFTQWIQESWLVSSISLGQTQIRSGALLLALLLRLNYYAAGTAWGDTLKAIVRDDLAAQFDQITATSLEKEAREADTSVPSLMAEQGVLDQYCEDFTAKARAGNIDPVFGRDSEIRQIIDILARRRKNNPICVGDPGVGKTAVVEGLALRIEQGQVPAFLQNTRLLGLDLGLLEAGASVKGEFERRLRGVIDAIKASVQPIILFIDEAHMLIGAGGQSGGGDAANLLKPALARGELRTIAATTWAEYKKYFEKDAALARRFQLVKLDEPTVATTIDILRGLKPHYEQAHGVFIRDDALVAAAELSERYIVGRLLPDKAVDLLDTAAARVRIGLDLKPAALERLELDIARLERERLALEREVQYGSQQSIQRISQIAAEITDLEAQTQELETHWQTQRVAAQQVIDLRAHASSNDEAAIDKQRLDAAQAHLNTLQQEHPLVYLETDPEIVSRVVSDWTGVPLGTMHRDAIAGVMNLDINLKQRIRGQDQALEHIADVLKAAQAGLRDPQQPLGVFLLVGPSGVGKTETALAVADQLFGGDQALITINMSEFQEKHSVSRLVGSPPGYVGYGEGGVLTEAVRKRPYSVVLLDEVEKADLDVLNLFYQVFDKGTLADGEGRLVDFSNTVVFLTSNLATDEITALSQYQRPDVEQLTQRIHPVLVRHFKPALLARMTVVPYYALGTSELGAIAHLKLERLAQYLQASNGIRLEFDPKVAQEIAQRCTEVDSGARNIDFIVRKSLSPAVSKVVLPALAQDQPVQGLHISLGPEGDWCIQTSKQTEA